MAEESAATVDDGDFYVSRPAPVFSVEAIDTSKLFAEFVNLWESKVYSDFTLKCAGRSFQVHRAIVTASSSYLSRKLSACYHNGDTVKCLEVEADPDILHLLLCFLYQGKLNDVLIEQAEALGKLADQMEVPELAKQCHQAYLSHLTPSISNCLPVWSNSLFANDTEMASKFESFALTNFPTLKNQSSFLSLPFNTVKVYLSHEKLCIQDPDERLSSAMQWLRHDRDRRIDSFPALLKALPLGNIGRGFLHYLQTDSALGDRADIQAILSSSLSHCKPQPDPPSINNKTIAYTAVMWRHQDHISVYPESFDKQVASISPPDTKCDLGLAACCSDGTNLYVSGLGDNKTEIHCCDVPTREWRRMNPLKYGREYHSMVVCNGKILVFGGEDPKTDDLIYEVEEVELPGGVVREAGRLSGSLHYSTCCCRYGDTDVIVMGHKDEECALVQIYSSASSNTTHVQKLPEEVAYVIKGVECVNETLLFCDHTNVYICPIPNVLKDVATGIQKLQHFNLPNSSCMLTFNTDKQQVFLLGGEAEHRVYETGVADLLADSKRGWSPVNVLWNQKLKALPGAMCKVWCPVINYG